MTWPVFIATLKCSSAAWAQGVLPRGALCKSSAASLRTENAISAYHAAVSHTAPSSLMRRSSGIGSASPRRASEIAPGPSPPQLAWRDESR
ncbi:hypothetical protein WMF26_29950 [Sorangium sp. So ce185]|uniref:hypothetical protein n=1 Tax=Sorangium sp. So ce185 TaxID=3133287 RepID=UPI003F5F4605